ncbi:MAG: ABC transporter permease [Gemmatimonadetes bacterium]|nr:ABC transporter permease [Gemmatimonadota bacterium]
MYALREAATAFRRAPVLTGLSAAMIALSLFVIGLFGLAAHNVRQALENVESRVEVVAYLRDDAPEASIQAAQEDIARFREVSAVRFISREEAFAVARREFDELGSIFGSLEVNPLPASLEISLHQGQADASVIRGVASRIGDMPIVEEVQFGEDWVDKVYVLRRIAGLAMLTLGLGFAAVAALIIGAAIRMAVFARKDEIVIMRLVGATDAFIRRPFVIEGMITGLIGAVLAVLGTWGVFRLLSNSVMELTWIPAAWLLAGVAAGTVVGLLASMVAVRRHLGEIV